MDKMPEDLRWLAENVSEWAASPWPRFMSNRGQPLFAFVRNGEAIYCEYGSISHKSARTFSMSDWQAARQKLEDERMDVIARNGNDGLHYDMVMTPEEESEYGPPARSKYHVEIRPCVWVDVYDVLHAFGVTNPGDQHAIKKMLMPGKRGVKPANQDRREAIASLERAVELERTHEGN